MGTEFFQRLDQIDVLLEQGPTDEEAGSRLISLIQDPDVRQYFFHQATSGHWLDVLPDDVLVRSGHKGGWAGGEYLARVGDQRPDDVVRLCIEALDERGGEVLARVLRILCAVPVDKSAGLIESIVERLQESELSGVIRPVLAFADVLLDARRGDEALSVLEPMIALVEPEDSDSFGSRALPSPKMRAWQYEEIISDQMEQAFEIEPLDTWRLALRTLEEGLRESVSEDRKDPVSGYWRAAIEDHAQNEPESHLDSLLDFVRDKAIELIEKDELSPLEIIERLRESGGPIFKRLELYICAQYGPRISSVVRENLTSRALFDASEYHHEYYHLLRCCFDVLGSDEREEVLGWIDDQSKRFQNAKEELEQWLGREVSRDEVRRSQDVQRLKRLSPVAPHLEGRRRTEYEELTETYDEPDHPDFLTYHYPVRQGPESPHDREVLEEASIDEIVRDLPRLFEEDDPSLVWPSEGVSRQLASVVSSRSTEFSRVALEFLQGGARAVQALLSGLRTSLDSEGKIAWDPVLELCGRVLEYEYSYSDPERGASTDDDRKNWALARRRVADLVAKGLAEEELAPGIEHRERVWELLSNLMSDPDPDPTSMRSSDLDPATESINTTRGQTLHAVFRYCSWVRRNLQAEERREGDAFDMRLVAEADDVLVAHLDPSHDASLAVRAVYGQWFPSMVSLDEEWAREHASTIFPSSLKRSDYWMAAWVTYLTFWGAHPRVYALLRSEYHRALDRFDDLVHDKADEYGLRDPGQQLGQHLIALYWQGALDEFDDEELLGRFFDRADPDLRVHTLEFVGRSLRSGERGSIDPGVLERLRDFWALRLETAESDQQARLDLHGFVSWFASGAFEPEWALRRLYKTLRLCKSVPQHPSGTIERLGSIASVDPRRALDSLMLLASEDFGRVSLRIHSEASKAILRQALESSDAELQERAESFIDGLGRQGLIEEFRDLVRPPPDG